MFTQLYSARRAFLLPLIFVSFSLASCESKPPAAGEIGNVSLTGAGASFPSPLYQRWFSVYNQQKPNVRISYQSIGSGAGVEQFIQGTVDFAASDVAVTDEQADSVKRGVITLPMTAGSIVLAYNLPNVQTGLKLPREVYTDILLGNIKNWNDPRIAAATGNYIAPTPESAARTLEAVELPADDLIAFITDPAGDIPDCHLHLAPDLRPISRPKQSPGS